MFKKLKRFFNEGAIPVGQLLYRALFSQQFGGCEDTFVRSAD